MYREMKGISATETQADKQTRCVDRFAKGLPIFTALFDADIVPHMVLTSSTDKKGVYRETVFES